MLCCLFPHTPSHQYHCRTTKGKPQKHNKKKEAKQSKETMDLTIKGWNGVKDTVELGEDDTPAVLRRKVASAVGLPEDGFMMSFGGEAVDEGYDMTQLSAGDTVVLTKVTKYEARAALHALGETDITAERLETPDGGPPPIAHFCGARAYGISIFFSREPKSGQVLDKYVVLLDLQTVWGGGTSVRRVLPGTPISYHKELESCMECRVL